MTPARYRRQLAASIVVVALTFGMVWAGDQYGQTYDIEPGPAIGRTGAAFVADTLTVLAMISPTGSLLCCAVIQGEMIDGKLTSREVWRTSTVDGIARGDDDFPAPSWYIEAVDRMCEADS